VRSAGPPKKGKQKTPGGYKKEAVIKGRCTKEVEFMEVHEKEENGDHISHSNAGCQD